MLLAREMIVNCVYTTEKSVWKSAFSARRFSLEMGTSFNNVSGDFNAAVTFAREPALKDIA